jgi:hypothetical protein
MEGGLVKQFEILFDRLDVWRHFPNYQLERRADIFFSLYLPEVLEAKLGFSVLPELVPEFPVRIGTIYPQIPIDKSYKIDYVALSADSETAILVELKTEIMSRRPEQDEYLLAAQKVGIPSLLDGLLDIFRATNAKRKYFYLLTQLESMGLLFIPKSVKEIRTRPSLYGLNADVPSIKNMAKEKVNKTLVVYVQPHGHASDIISFSEVAEVVRRHDDPVSQRFADSLSKWATIQAGEF